VSNNHIPKQQKFIKLFRLSWPISRVLSRTVIHLGLLSPTISSSLPESSADHTVWFLFGLAPSGVYLAITVTNNAVRSYHTISPLPLTKLQRRYFFCCTFRELTFPRRYLALCPMEPGLSSDFIKIPATVRPAQLRDYVQMTGNTN